MRWPTKCAPPLGFGACLASRCLAALAAARNTVPCGAIWRGRRVGFWAAFLTACLLAARGMVYLPPAAGPPTRAAFARVGVITARATFFFAGLPAASLREADFTA